VHGAIYYGKLSEVGGGRKTIHIPHNRIAMTYPSGGGLAAFVPPRRHGEGHALLEQMHAAGGLFMT
jgi:hypothetical protein